LISYLKANSVLPKLEVIEFSSSFQCISNRVLQLTAPYVIKDFVLLNDDRLIAINTSQVVLSIELQSFNRFDTLWFDPLNCVDTLWCLAHFEQIKKKTDSTLLIAANVRIDRDPSPSSVRLDYDHVLMEVSYAGNLLSSKFMGSTDTLNGSIVQHKDDETGVKSIAIDDHGHIYTCSTSGFHWGSLDDLFIKSPTALKIAKYDSNLNPQWEMEYIDSSGSRLTNYGVQCPSSGGVLIYSSKFDYIQHLEDSLSTHILRIHENGKIYTLNSVNVRELQDNIVLFPVPCRDYLYITTRTTKRLFYQITDLEGKSTLNGCVTNNAIDVTHLPSGTYIVTIKRGSASYHRKFVKL
jgi:hypothetical protein